RPREIERGEPCAVPSELGGDRAEAAADFEHAAPAPRVVVDESREERRAARVREPGGTMKRLVYSREELARALVVGKVGPPPVPEIVHRMLVPPEANAAGNIVF